jgi:hypothetical protein
MPSDPFGCEPPGDYPSTDVILIDCPRQAGPSVFGSRYFSACPVRSPRAHVSKEQEHCYKNAAAHDQGGS